MQKKYTTYCLRCEKNFESRLEIPSKCTICKSHFYDRPKKDNKK